MNSWKSVCPKLGRVTRHAALDSNGRQDFKVYDRHLGLGSNVQLDPVDFKVLCSAN